MGLDGTRVETCRRGTLTMLRGLTTGFAFWHLAKNKLVNMYEKERRIPFFRQKATTAYSRSIAGTRLKAFFVCICYYDNSFLAIQSYAILSNRQIFSDIFYSRHITFLPLMRL